MIKKSRLNSYLKLNIRQKSISNDKKSQSSKNNYKNI
jgi:hypothetical protein